MSSLVHLDGALLPRDEARIAPDDRGFLFGDGIYEVVRAFDGRLVHAARHWRRLADGLAGLALPRPAALPDDAALDALCHRLLDANDLRRGHAILYLQITRGAAVPRTHHFPPAGTPPTVYATAAPFAPPDATRDRGARVLLQPDLRWRRCDLKTVNLLPNVLAKQAAVEAGADEAVMVRDGIVTEGSSSNVLAVVGGTLRTHPLGPGILPGVTRAVALEHARALGLALDETPLREPELATVEELFLTSTTNDVMPIVRVNDLVIGDGTPGRLTMALAERVLGAY